MLKELLKDSKFKQLALTLGLIVPIEFLSFFSIHLPWFIEYPLFASIIYYFGRDVIVGGLQSLVKFRFSNINLLMTVATFGAIYLGELEEAVIIIVLFAVSEALEEFGITKSQNALEELVDKTPKTALIKGHETKTPIEKITITILWSKPGHYLLDLVIKGEQLMKVLLGEPLPKMYHEVVVLPL
jgi:Cd2+/Zn2+-exporting ATPase